MGRALEGPHRRTRDGYRHPVSLRDLARLAAVTVLLVLVSGCGRDVSSERIEQLQNEWWDWAASSPVDRNPVLDTTGVLCGEKQPDDLWFLAGTFPERTSGPVSRRCTIPEGLPIVLPAVNVLADDVYGCLDVKDQMSGVVTLDGADVPLERVDGAQVGVSGVMGNPVTPDLLVYTYTGCGLWARIAAPSPGPHTLTVTGSSPGFATDVTYALDVTDG